MCCVIKVMCVDYHKGVHSFLCKFYIHEINEDWKTTKKKYRYRDNDITRNSPGTYLALISSSLLSSQLVVWHL